jgi:hypothetical protein
MAKFQWSVIPFPIYHLRDYEFLQNGKLQFIGLKPDWIVPVLRANMAGRVDFLWLK